MPWKRINTREIRIGKTYATFGANQGDMNKPETEEEHINGMGTWPLHQSKKRLGRGCGRFLPMQSFILLQKDGQCTKRGEVVFMVEIRTETGDSGWTLLFVDDRENIWEKVE